MNYGTELVYIVFGYNEAQHPWFQTVIESVRRYSPTTLIRVLSDTPIHWIQHTDARLYSKAADEFERVYRHHSPNSVALELSALKRWFVLHEYMVATDTRPVWMLDWDMLLFTDLAKEQVPVDMTLPIDVFCCENPFKLEAWLRRIYSAYCQRNEDYLRWVDYYKSKRWDSVSDMRIAFDTLGDHYCFRTERDGCVWENNITCSEGFVMTTDESEHSPKKLQWKSGQPHAERPGTGRLVRLKNIHCWGKHKYLTEQWLQKGIQSL